MSERRLRILFWGTYDLSKPRNRILSSGLRASGAEVTECHASVWERVRDKGVLGPLQALKHLLRAGLIYPRLIWRFLRAPAPDLVLIGYLGQLDVVLLAPFARLRKVPVVWDQFISLYDTVVEDRAKVSRKHPLARLLYAWEWLGCRAATRVLMDTKAHAAYVAQTFHLPTERVSSVWVGAETEHFPGAETGASGAVNGATRGSANAPLKVLFYGQFIPLHGIDTIVRAAQLLKNDNVSFLLIGTGQEEPRIRELLKADPVSKLEWKEWVEYEALVQSIHAADVCLGIFGTSGKASRVIPNKVFQIVSARRPLITQDSPAIRELFPEEEPGVWLVPPGDAEALAATLRRIAQDPNSLVKEPYAKLQSTITPRAIGDQALRVFEQVLSSARTSGS